MQSSITIIIILSAIVPIVITLFVVKKVFSSISGGNAKEKKLLASGIPAQGRILQIQMGGMTMSVGVQRHLQVIFTIEVQPANAPPYQATCKKMVSELHIPQIQPGTPVQVRYDPDNPGEIAIESINPYQQGMMQPGMMQPGMMQPGMQQPGMQQGMMQQGLQQPGMPPGGGGYQQGGGQQGGGGGFPQG